MSDSLVERSISPHAARIIVFTRYPEPGKTKTRMIPALGPDGAAQLQIELTKHTLGTVTRFCDRHSCELEVRFTGGDVGAMRKLFGVDCQYRPQAGDDLGERMANSIATAFDEKICRVVVIGSDCPGIDDAILEESMQSLTNNDLVLGPALDGGYYLIGVREPQPQLFQEIDWGSDQVLRQTLAKAKRPKLRTHSLRSLADIDRPEDLVEFHGIGLSEKSPFRLKFTQENL